MSNVGYFPFVMLLSARLSIQYTSTDKIRTPDFWDDTESCTDYDVSVYLCNAFTSTSYQCISNKPYWLISTLSPGTGFACADGRGGRSTKPFQTLPGVADLQAGGKCAGLTMGDLITR